MILCHGLNSDYQSTMFQIRSDLTSVYTPAQVQAYAERIGLEFDISTFVPDLPNLSRIIKRHLLAVPFDASRLHYSNTHEVDTSPDATYERIVVKRFGGSWCYGQNGFFMYMLRGLGYRVVPIAGRVNVAEPASPPLPPTFTFLAHLVLLVQLSTSDFYLVDVGFGGNNPVRPIPLPLSILFRLLSSQSELGQLAKCRSEIESLSLVSGGASPEQHRLSLQHHPLSGLEPSPLTIDWALQYRSELDGPWTTMFIFKLVEIIGEHDWIPLAQWFSAHPADVFANNVLVVKFFVAGDNDVDSEDAEIGRISMVGTKVSRRLGAKSECLKEFKTERERVQILREEFGVVVEEEEVRNIEGRKPELPLI